MKKSLPCLLVAGVLCAIACHRARNSGDGISWRAMAACVCIGVLEPLLLPLPLSTKEAIAIACVSVCAATDISSGYVYNAVTYAAFVLILASAAIEGDLSATLLGAAASVSISLTLYLVSGKRGLGLGDVKLFAVVGASLSCAPAAAVFCAAFVGGAMYATVGLLFKRLSIGDRIAFAPYIAAATVGVVAARSVQ